MKKVLLGSSALLAAGFVASPALAADGIKLSIGGYMNTAVLVNIDDNSKHVSNSNRNPDLGHGHYSDGVFQDARLKFSGETTLDNGVTVGARVTLYAEQVSGNQFHDAFAYFRGGFGDLRIGAQDGALQALCVTPVGGTENFGAFSQNQVINNAFSGMSAGVCNGVGSFRSANGDRAQKIVYITPNFAGFQLGLSWTPNGDKKSADDGVGDFHSGMPKVTDGEQRNIVDVALNYSRDFDGWSIDWDGAVSLALSQGGHDYPRDNKGRFYQTGLNLTFGQWSVGGAFQYYDNGLNNANEDEDGVVGNQDGWVAGGGIAYNVDAWTVGLQYSHSQFDNLTKANRSRSVNTVALTGKYDMGPGIALDSTVQYTWANGQHGDAAAGGYHAVSLGLGTSFNF